MDYLVIAMISGTLGFMIAAVLCAAGRADEEAELLRLYETLKQYKEIENQHQKHFRYYREKIKMLKEQSDKRNKVPQNETEVLKLLNESIEMLWIIHEHTRKNKKFISEAIDALHSARRSNYVNHVDRKSVV